MKHQIYIIDYLGKSASNTSYVNNLKALLEGMPEYKVDVLSNYSAADEQPFLIDQYSGNVLKMAVGVYRNYRRLMRLISEYPEALYILVVYGHSIDISLMRIVSSARYHIIDILDESLKIGEWSDRFLYDVSKTYCQIVSNVFAHSEDTVAFLEDIGYIGNILSLPRNSSHEESNEGDWSGLSQDAFYDTFRAWHQSLSAN